MLDTFIKNRGTTKTIIHNNNKNYYNEVNWDADYDGEKANISLDIDDNGKKGHMELNMNGDDLAEILTIPSVNKTLDKRLYSDFLSKKPSIEDRIIQISTKPMPILANKSHSVKHKKKVHFEENKLQNELEHVLETILDKPEPEPEQKYTHISSPAQNEELVFPLTLARNHSTRRRKNHKTHNTYKVYRKLKSNNSNAKTLRKKLAKHHNFYSRRTF
jgi:hypothetical protein